MSDVTRYYFHGDEHLEEHMEGNWVRYEDYEALEYELESLKDSVNYIVRRSGVPKGYE